MSLLPDYSRQAGRYDQTRSASPSVLRPLREALRVAPGKRLADIGGGTGNYALALKEEGWQRVPGRPLGRPRARVGGSSTSADQLLRADAA